MANKHVEKAKELGRKVGVATGLIDPKAHWIPIPGKAYDEMHPAVRMRQSQERKPDRAEHLKNFSVGQSSNVVHINTARQNRELKRRRGE